MLRAVVGLINHHATRFNYGIFVDTNTFMGKYDDIIKSRLCNTVACPNNAEKGDAFPYSEPTSADRARSSLAISCLPLVGVRQNREQEPDFYVSQDSVFDVGGDERTSGDSARAPRGSELT